MAFIKEYISQEDIEKYGIRELHQHYSRLAKDRYALRNGLMDEKPWMVDRKRDLWFMLLGIGIEDDIPPMATGEDYYVLYYKGEHIEVMMHENHKEGSTKFSDNPFRIRWDILSINKPDSLKDVQKEELIELITEAMIVRGNDGIKKFVKNFDIKVRYIGEK